jgi:hypothetical protein
MSEKYATGSQKSTRDIWALFKMARCHSRTTEGNDRCVKAICDKAKVTLRAMKKDKGERSGEMRS